MQNNYPVLKPKNTLNEHRWHFATALIVPYYQILLPHTHALSPLDLLDPTGATYDDASVV